MKPAPHYKNTQHEQVLLPKKGAIPPRTSHHTLHEQYEVTYCLAADRGHPLPPRPIVASSFYGREGWGS